MRILDIVLRNLAFVFLGLFGKEVSGVFLLESGATFVFLVLEDGVDGGIGPLILATRGLDTFFNQIRSNGTLGVSF